MLGRLPPIARVNLVLVLAVAPLPCAAEDEHLLVLAPPREPVEHGVARARPRRSPIARPPPMATRERLEAHAINVDWLVRLRWVVWGGLSLLTARVPWGLSIGLPLG